MHLGTQPAHSIQFDRKENEIVKAAGASVPAYVRNSKMAGTQPVTAVRGNLAAARTSILNRANSPTEIAFIRLLRLFEDVPLENCILIVAHASKKLFSRHQTIFSVGDAIEHSVLLLSGCVKITQQGQLRRLRPRPQVRFDRSGRSTLHRLVWDAVTFDRLMDLCAVFRRNMLRALEECLEKMEVRFSDISTGNVGARLSSELIRSSKHFARSENGHPQVRLCHTKLGQLTGATLWSLNRQLSRWQELGIVIVEREVVQILNLPALENYAKEEDGPGR